MSAVEASKIRVGPAPYKFKSTGTVAAKKKPATWQHLTAGSVAGINGIIASYPFDTVRIRIQTQPHPPIYTGMIDCFQQMIRKEGTSALYRGITSPIAGTAMIKSTVFGAYGTLQRMLQTREGRDATIPLTALEQLICSMGSGLASSFVVTPVERVKCAQQVAAKGTYSGSFDCAVKLLRSQGLFRGLYAGFNATASRDVPSYGLYFGSYELVKRMLAPEDGSAITPGRLAVAGATAGVMSWIPIYPIDVVKSSLQSDASGTMYKGFMDCARQKYAQGGVGIFFRGLSPTIARAIPCHAAVFVSYEIALRQLQEFTDSL
eukprot:GFYU01012426.1.p1 GENE.GFYU01012426.1~~GFYU01012426.1.p1  ORF type:complete len:319 (+),score=66.15 GFYU01012426.1:192-1148(+)